MPALKSLSMEMSQEGDEVSSFGINELVDGFVGNRKFGIFLTKLTGNLLGRKPLLKFAKNKATCLLVFETQMGSGKLVTMCGSKVSPSW